MRIEALELALNDYKLKSQEKLNRIEMEIND